MTFMIMHLKLALKNDDSSSDGVCSELSRNIATPMFPPNVCTSKMDKSSHNTENVTKEKEKKKKQTLLLVKNNDNSSTQKYNEAMKRHNRFMKAKLSKFAQYDKHDVERKQRGEHLKKQRDIIIKKRNEMRKKRICKESTEIVTLHRVPSIRLSTSKQLRFSKLEQKNTETPLSSNIVHLIQGFE